MGLSKAHFAIFVKKKTKTNEHGVLKEMFSRFIEEFSSTKKPLKVEKDLHELSKSYITVGKTLLEKCLSKHDKTEF